MKEVIQNMLQSVSDSTTISIFLMLSSMISKILETEVSVNENLKRKLTPEECLQSLSQCLKMSADFIQEQLDKRVKEQESK